MNVPERITTMVGQSAHSLNVAPGLVEGLEDAAFGAAAWRDDDRSTAAASAAMPLNSFVNDIEPSPCDVCERVSRRVLSGTRTNDRVLSLPQKKTRERDGAPGLCSSDNCCLG